MYSQTIKAIRLAGCSEWGCSQFQRGADIIERLLDEYYAATTDDDASEIWRKKQHAVDSFWQHVDDFCTVSMRECEF